MNRTYFEKIIKSKIDEMKEQAVSLFPEYLLRDDLNDDGDVAEGSIENEIKLTLTGIQKKNISDLEEALSRLKIGNYGTCQECEKPISEKRLLAKPESIFCIKCQEKREKESRRH